MNRYTHIMADRIGDIDVEAIPLFQKGFSLMIYSQVRDNEVFSYRFI